MGGVTVAASLTVAQSTQNIARPANVWTPKIKAGATAKEVVSFLTTKAMATATTTTTTAAVHTMAVIAAPKQSRVARLKRNTASNVSAWIPTEKARVIAPGLAVLKITKGMVTVTTTTTTAAVHTMAVIAAPKQSRVARL